MIQDICDGIDQARQALRSTTDLAKAEQSQAANWGNRLSGAGVPAQGSAPSKTPRRIEEIGRNLPVRANRKDPTTGEFNGERIVSGKDPASVADFRPDERRGWPDALTRHVESHVAARMRRQGLTEGEVVLTNITCGNRGFDNNWPESCEKYLPTILPRDARLTVWATPDGGRTWWSKTYIETGERIQP